MTETPINTAIRYIVGTIQLATTTVPHDQSIYDTKRAGLPLNNPANFVSNTMIVVTYEMR